MTAQDNAPAPRKIATTDPRTGRLAPAGAGYATTAQKDWIGSLLRKAEYDTRTCALPHRALARRAGVESPEPGTNVDDWIGWLRTRDASKLIDALKREAEDGGDET